MDLTHRPRRLRQDRVRGLVSETSLEPSDLIAPVFVDATTDERIPIESMPGHERVPNRGDRHSRRGGPRDGCRGDHAVRDSGVERPRGEPRAWEDGVIQEALRRVTSETDAYVITDVCLCEYTDHGHCGPLEEELRTDGSAVEADVPACEPTLTVDNDATLEALDHIVTSHARAGADMVAPSGMIDGMVGVIRSALDGAGFEHVPIMSYAAKYESAFYGPFRDAADGDPSFGNRRHYQMDPANSRGSHAGSST